jgi:peroxiredoxin
MNDEQSRTPIADAVAARQVAARQAGQEPNAYAREQAHLAALGDPDLSARVGTPFPRAALIDVNGTPTTLEEALAGAPAVVILYRGAWCPYCNIALRTYQSELVGPLEQRGIRLVAISPQLPDGSLSMQEKNDLTFTVLSDPGNTIATELGVLTRPSDDALELQLEHGPDLAALNADGTPGLPLPTAAILDADRTIRWIDVHRDHTTRTEPDAILRHLEGIR